jgi:hypothetical protein
MKEIQMAQINDVWTDTGAIRALRRKSGATGAELAELLGRIWKPTHYQLAPIAERHGYTLAVMPRDAKHDSTRYAFVTPARKGRKTRK